MQTKDEELIYNVNYENAMFNYALLLLKQKRYEESETICLHQIPNTFVTGQKNAAYFMRCLAGLFTVRDATRRLLKSCCCRSTRSTRCATRNTSTYRT